MLPTAVVVTLGVLADAVSPEPAATTSSGRWDPAWLELLVLVAVVLVGAAVLWWLLLVMRVQDRFRDERSPRRPW